MPSHLPTEALRILRFLIVGGAVALTYGGLFLGLRHVDVPLWLANGVAFGAGVLIQYVAHTKWTFGASLRNAPQQARFIAVICFGVVFSYLVTTILAPWMGWGDQIAAALVIFVLPVCNFTLYRLWVFRSKGD